MTGRRGGSGQDEQAPGAASQRAGDRPSPADGTRGLVLPADLDRALRYLDDAELDRLQQAVSAEARRRGQQPAEGDASDSGREVRKTAGRATRPASARKREPVPVTPGQERLIRAAHEAGLGPAAIAREFRVSRAQVERVIAAARRRT